MPYIKQERRKEALTNPLNAGELNYAITMSMIGYYEEDPCYQRINDVLASLDCLRRIHEEKTIWGNDTPWGPATEVGNFTKDVFSVIETFTEGHDAEQAYYDVKGAISGATLEFYRRVAVPYEESKIEKNGDVY